jgi:hypothetical protein
VAGPVYIPGKTTGAGRGSIGGVSAGHQRGIRESGRLPSIAAPGALRSQGSRESERARQGGAGPRAGRGRSGRPVCKLVMMVRLVEWRSDWVEMHELGLCHGAAAHRRRAQGRYMKTGKRPALFSQISPPSLPLLSPASVS